MQIILRWRGDTINVLERRSKAFGTLINGTMKSATFQISEGVSGTFHSSSVFFYLRV